MTGQRITTTYLRNLANDTLPENWLLSLPWHGSEARLEVARAVDSPHPCVLAALCPQLALEGSLAAGR